jgi:O-antigen ligase
LEWAVVIFAAVVQQGAFLSIPLYFGNPSLHIRQDQNDLNTIAVAGSLLSIMPFCISQRRSIGFLARKNALSILFLLLVLGSAFWSIHPDLSLRRGMGYVVTLLVAAYLTIRFDVDNLMKVLSYSFAISALGSLLFIAVFPAAGIMNVVDLTGNWRGVFPHKTALGLTMAVAVFVELFILSSHRETRWRYALLAIFLSLVVMSHSATALIVSTIFLIGAFVFSLGRSSIFVGIIASLIVVTFGCIALWVFLSDPELLFGALGKDLTLTGRTGLWKVVTSLIAERPFFGYGYRAMWVLNDADTIRIDRLVGGWGVGSSHNSFLELTLQLGLFGMGLILLIVVIAFARAFKCWLSVPGSLGFFSVIFFVGTLVAGQTEEVLGQNQVIEWVVFNLLMFSCGAALANRQLPRRRSEMGSMANVRTATFPQCN